ncbi:zinc ribbon domain-containing protein [Frankia sp. R82]|uniref:FmdB family zinc ribbon protein n=1 Tax=Frankia sp. R82 TaxID=2950553 RepID=UPI0020444FD5|nr:zinc ribbon domain-containing protein [Frankia sp. R82]MCM3887118.1 zinc ribbon domain-containing protein [Frankia sp. R82]
MPAYDYRCRVCDTSFEVRRSMTESAPDSGVTCPAGHVETSRVFSAVAVARGVSASGSPAPAMAAAPSSGGACCGGGCCG